MKNEEKHKDIIAVLSQSLPKPPPEDNLGLPGSLLKHLDKSETKKAKKNIFSLIISWLQSPQFTYAATTGLAVLVILMVLKPNQPSKETTQYGLRGTETPENQASKIIVFRPQGPIWQEFQQLTESSGYIQIDDQTALKKILAEASSHCIVINYEKAAVFRFAGGETQPARETSLPETGIELLELIENWQK